MAAKQSLRGPSHVYLKLIVFTDDFVSIVRNMMGAAPTLFYN